MLAMAPKGSVGEAWAFAESVRHRAAAMTQAEVSQRLAAPPPRPVDDDDADYDDDCKPGTADAVPQPKKRPRRE